MGLFTVPQIKFLNQALGQRTAHPLRNQGIFSVQFHTGHIGVFFTTVLGNPHVPGQDAFDGAIFVIQDLGPGEAWEYFDAHIFRLFRQPATDIAQADDIIALVAHHRRQQDMGHINFAVFLQKPMLVIGNRGKQWSAQFFPIGQEFIECYGINDSTGQDMRPDLGAFFQHADHELFALCIRQLFELYRRAQTGGPAAHNDDIIFHKFTFHEAVIS